MMKSALKKSAPIPAHPFRANRFNVNMAFPTDTTTKFGTSNNKRFSSPIFRQMNSDGDPMTASAMHGHATHDSSHQNFNTNPGRTEVDVGADRPGRPHNPYHPHDGYVDGNFIREIKPESDYSSLYNNNPGRHTNHYTGKTFILENFSNSEPKLIPWRALTEDPGLIYPQACR